MTDHLKTPSLSAEETPHLRRGESRPLSSVTKNLKLSNEFSQREMLDSEAVRVAVHWVKESRPNGQNHWPALVIALVAQIESLLDAENKDSMPDIFSSNPREVKGANNRAVNTLNFSTSDGNFIRLRQFYNASLEVIRHTMLREHPNNPGHATQSWPAYTELIQTIASLSPAERRYFAEEIWKLGVLEMPFQPISTTTARAPRPFELILRKLPTSVPGVRGGALFQALSYGYLRADSPNLILESHNVNTGSSRAGMLGDVDGFRGQEPELAAEVKDMNLDTSNVTKQLDDFLSDIEVAPNVTAMVFCETITEDARHYIQSRGATVLDKNELTNRVSIWDVPKQEEAVRGVEYYLGRIQKSHLAVSHLRTWLSEQGLDAGLGLLETSQYTSRADLI